MYYQMSTAWRVRKCRKQKKRVLFSDKGKDPWYKAVFECIRSRLLSSEKRSLLWQTMNSDGRFAYRVRSEQRPANTGEADHGACRWYLPEPR
jgi:hypothetical protein